MFNALLISLSLTTLPVNLDRVQSGECKRIVATIQPELSRSENEVLTELLGKTDLPSASLRMDEFNVLRMIRERILSEKFPIALFMKDPNPPSVEDFKEAKLQLFEELLAQLNISQQVFRKAERIWNTEQLRLRNSRESDFNEFTSAMRHLDSSRQSLVAQFRGQVKSDVRNLTISDEGREALFVLYQNSDVDRGSESVSNFVRFLLQDTDLGRNELNLQEKDALSVLRDSIENYPIEKAIRAHLLTGQSVREFSRTLVSELESKNGPYVVKNSKKVFRNISEKMKIYGGSHFDRMLRFVYFIHGVSFEPRMLDMKTRKKYRELALKIEDQIPRRFLEWGHPVRRSANLIQGGLSASMILGSIAALGIGGSHLAHFIGNRYAQTLPQAVVTPLQAAPSFQQIQNYGEDILERMNPVIDFSQKNWEPWLKKEYWPMARDGYFFINEEVEAVMKGNENQPTQAHQIRREVPR